MKFSQKGLDAYKAENSRSLDSREVGDSAALKALNDKAPGLLKTGTPSVMPSAPAGLQKTEQKTEQKTASSGTSQAARFLLLLGKEEAGKVLRKMSESEIEQVTAEIARIKEINRDEALQILQTFGDRFNLKGNSSGGLDRARSFLIQAFGEERAENIIAKAVPDSLPRPFAFMNDLSLPQVLQLLKDEPPQTCSVVLSFLEPATVSAYLKSCDPSAQVTLVRLMGRKRELHPEALSSMDNLLSEKAHRIGKVNEVEINGKDRLTEILKHMDTGAEKRILGDLEEGNPELGKSIRDQLHTIDCIFQMRSRDLQNLLLEMDNDRIAFILRGKEERVVDHMLNHLSSQRKLIVEETMILSPKVSRKEVDKETREFLNLIRKREEEGTYVLLGRNEEEYI
ncbi:MAG: FliG C-terminal domain-containing protein [Spirochaetales bacterium]|nr:FliG C-terminal domain-containing protein [Spirochaetales bacterium]